MIKTCPVCGKDFNADHNNRKYCSDRCRYKRYYQRHRQERIDYANEYKRNNLEQIKIKRCSFKHDDCAACPHTDCIF